MNNFIEEIANIAKLPFNEILKDYKLIIFITLKNLQV